MIFFYEAVFVAIALLAVVIGELWSRTIAVVMLGGSFAVAWLAVASFRARLAAGIAEDDRHWMSEAQAGLKHVRLLFGVAALAALVWRLVAG